MFVLAVVLSTMLAQEPAQTPPQAPVVLNNGACMDSPRAVPQALIPPAVRSMQVVKIDRVTSTATMTFNETIGFLYTLQDGTTWLGQRSSDYMSAADARAINQVLASTHMADQPIAAFPPQTKLGVATKYQQFFKVNIPANAFDSLRIRLDPCVAWPAGGQLPDPSM